MAEPCVLSSADGCSKVIRFGCRDWVIKLTKQPWRMRQQRPSLFHSIIFHPRLVSVYSPKRLWYPPSPLLSARKPQSLSRSQPLFHSRSFSLSHTIDLLSPGPVWCWSRSGAAPSPFLSLSLFPLKIHPKLFIYFSPAEVHSSPARLSLSPPCPFFLITGAGSGPSPPPTQPRPRPMWLTRTALTSHTVPKSLLSVAACILYASFPSHLRRLSQSLSVSNS